MLSPRPLAPLLVLLTGCMSPRAAEPEPGRGAASAGGSVEVAAESSGGDRDTASPRDGAQSRDTAAEERRPPPVELNGTAWTVVEAPVARVPVTMPCHGSIDLLQVTAPGGVVHLYRSFPSPAQGVPHSPPHELARGGWEGDTLRLEGVYCPYHREGQPGPREDPVTYELRLEPSTGNLVGVRNGTSIRLAPADLRYPAHCGPPPP